MESNLKYENGLMFKPLTGNILAVASGLSFFFLCMILPLVGPAGSRVANAGQNKAVFLLVLFTTFAFAASASYSKMGRRKVDASGYPWLSLALCVLCALILVVLLMGGFAI